MPITSRLAAIGRLRDDLRGHKMHPNTYEHIKPTERQKEKMERLRAAAKAYNDILETEIPDGPDKTFILRNHRTNAMWINVAITRHPDGSPRS